MKKRKYIILTAVVVITLISTSGAAIASAMGDVRNAGFSFHPKNNLKGNKPGIGGAIAAINGTTLIITGQDGTTYTVDAAKAKITRGFGPSTETLTLTDIKVGDNIGIIGTVSGTTVTAKVIIDGVGMIRGKEIGAAEKLHTVGTVVDVSPYSFTVTVKNFHGKNKASAEATTYTIDTTSNTNVTKDGTTASLGDIVSGQMVIVTGSINNDTKTVAATKVNIMTAQEKGNHFSRRPHMMGEKNK